MKHIKLFEDLFESENLKNPLSKEEINKIKYFYHATTPDKFASIMQNGITLGTFGDIFLADSPENAAKFLIMSEPHIYVFKIDASKLKKNKLKESFDHNSDIFDCRAYVYEDIIKPYIFARSEIRQFKNPDLKNYED